MQYIYLNISNRLIALASLYMSITPTAIFDIMDVNLIQQSISKIFTVKDVIPNTKDYGTFLFKGVVAAPYLEKHGLPADTLETGAWATNGNVDKVFLKRIIHFIVVYIGRNPSISYFSYFNLILTRMYWNEIEIAHCISPIIDSFINICP